MKYICSFIVILFLPIVAFTQSNFSVPTYEQFLQQNKDMESATLLQKFAPKNVYYKAIQDEFSNSRYSFLDSVLNNYPLTNDELELLKNNHFVITERLNYNCFGEALHEIYKYDLPVFLTSDAVLHALHMSYDRILQELEMQVMDANLEKMLNGLYAAYPKLMDKYESIDELAIPLKDVDIYITIAKSLIDNKLASPQKASKTDVQQLWDAIQAEQMIKMPLFSDRNRKLDFSQFTVRGHYNQDYWRDGLMRNLGQYFKAMMWLGRIDFMLTAPPSNPWEQDWSPEEIKRMNLGTALLNEMIELAGIRNLLNENGEIIDFMVGESDNLTPAELDNVLENLSISSVADLLDEATYQSFQNALQASADYGQRILSNYFLMDPFSSEPDQLPISFRLMGQRFIIDSYVFSSVVYDRIIYQNKKVWRPMPDPLDAMFVLGNDDAAQLLKDDLDKYKYSSQLSALRYLVDAYDDDFWSQSLYNVWLQAIRSLNPQQNTAEYPLFMKTTAWQQQKLNSQLASWAQLRHDNLLYAKQSYTGGTGCSYPHSYIEPYPELYSSIAAFADKAYHYFSGKSFSTVLYGINDYFPRLKESMNKLELLAQKELNGEQFNAEEIDWLHRMLFIDGMSGAPPFSGWYSDLFYFPDDAAEGDFIIADVHTQPTDESGAEVGHVLHVGVGKINMGFFLAESPSLNYEPMVFVGPVTSYYEKITSNFKRLTDEAWAESVEKNDVPARPDWVNSYLADGSGKKRTQGRELYGQIFTDTGGENPEIPNSYYIAQNYPNPFNPSTIISYSIPTSQMVKLIVFDLLGRNVATLVNKVQPAGKYAVTWQASDVSSGVYFCRIEAGSYNRIIKMTLIR